MDPTTLGGVLPTQNQDPFEAYLARRYGQPSNLSTMPGLWGGQGLEQAQPQRPAMIGGQQPLYQAMAQRQQQQPPMPQKQARPSPAYPQLPPVHTPNLGQTAFNMGQSIGQTPGGLQTAAQAGRLFSPGALGNDPLMRSFGRGMMQQRMPQTLGQALPPIGG